MQEQTSGQSGWGSQAAGAASANDPTAEIQGILEGGRHEAERILREAERRVSELVQANTARATETLNTVLGELRDVLSSLETEHRTLSERFDSIGQAIDRCRSEIEVVRGHVAGQTGRSEPSTPPAGEEPGGFSSF